MVLVFHFEQCFILQKKMAINLINQTHENEFIGTYLFRKIQEKIGKKSLPSGIEINILKLKVKQNINLFVTLDPTLSDLPLMGSPLSMIGIICVYLLVIKLLGPAIMEHRKPINPVHWIMGYNVCQIIANALLFSFVSITSS